MAVSPVHPSGITRSDWTRLRWLPWEEPLDEWPEHGVQPLSIRRGESRHMVLFVEVGRRRYAVKETSPVAAEREIAALRELRRRGCSALDPVGSVLVRGEPIAVGVVAGLPVYLSGDIGYCVTRLAERVLPQSILYRYPFTEFNKHLLWNAVVKLLLDLHSAGVYWGDPSLANVLMDLRGHRLTAILADAETAELVTGELSDGLRRQDLDAFIESIEWQAEDIRLARGLGEEVSLLSSADARYIRSRYDGLREARANSGLSDHLWTRLQRLEHSMQRLDVLGYGVVNLGSRILHLGTLVAAASPLEGAGEASDGLEVGTVRPGWYVRQLRELLGIRVPRAYASRVYHHLMIDKWLLSEQAGHDVGLEAAAADWLEHYHQPTMAFLRTYAPAADDLTLFATYLDVLDHTWQMSTEQQRSVPIEEGAMDYALARTRGNG